MTFEEFEKIVNESLKGLDSWASSYGDTDGFDIELGKIVQKHVSSGASGGSCWGTDAEYFSNNNPMQEFLPLDKILKEVKPDISYLGYREIFAMIKESEECDQEYYGNYTNFILHTLDIRDLYDKLFPQ